MLIHCSIKSYSFREMKAIRHVLESYSEELRGKDDLNPTYNRNAKIVLSVGSHKKELQQEAVAVH